MSLESKSVIFFGLSTIALLVHNSDILTFYVTQAVSSCINVSNVFADISYR